MKRSNFSIITICTILITALSFISCNFEDDESSKDNSNLQTSAFKGTWTTVAVESIPTSQTKEKLMGYSFEIYWDDGYMYETRYYSNNGYVLFEDSELKYEYSGHSLMKVLSYDKSNLKVQIPEFDGAVLVMKKLGTLTNEDYKNKLCYGYWLHCLDSAEPYLMDYEILYDGKSAQQTANSSYGDRFQLVEFKSNGTGNCYRGNSGYSFAWTLNDKKLSIKTSTGKEKTTKLSFIGIEGEVYLKYEVTFNWF